MIKTPADVLVDQTSGAPMEALRHSNANESPYAGGTAGKLVGRNAVLAGDRRVAAVR